MDNDQIHLFFFGEEKQMNSLTQPSVEELEEVELLNKALKKALKVRGSLKCEESPKIPSTTQTVPANPTTNEKTTKPLQKLGNTGIKAGTYQLKPPYKTMPEKRRVGGSAKPASTSRSLLSSRPVLSSRPTSTTTSATTARPGTSNAARSPPLVPQTSEKSNSGKVRLAESKEIPTRTDGTLRNLQPSLVPETECSASTSTAAVIKSPKQEQMRQKKAFTLKDVGVCQHLSTRSRLPLWRQREKTRSTLKLPKEYQQLYKKNRRLWEKYFEIQARVPASRPSFIQQLQTTFIPESPELSLFEIEEEAARLQRAVKRLEENIETAKTLQGSGPSHWQHQRTLLMLEAMQDEVTKSHCELQKLELVAEQYNKWCEKLSINTDCSEVMDCPFQFCTMPSELIYSNPEELRELTTTYLRVRELQQKIYLHKVMSEELLAEAESQCRSSSPSYVMIRAIYTLLCEGGDAFPALVHDDS
uniref:Uncharacterized protein n=1 Tax=Pyxicephalus adspersus TaxID=30357 RepID=A0AAV2ZV62_PYXAD|nr:TPA: hypothetical protein GDO54_015235 [Pyxicephalus adspersus]